MDADLLARHALGWDLATLVSRAADEAPAGFDARFAALIDRRLRREPVAYIRGTQEFWGRDFVVRPGVLIPRPETEFIIEEAIAWSLGRDAGAAPLRVLDIGAGSGCLAVTLALELTGARVAATDISSDALDTARENQRRLGAEVSFTGARFSPTPACRWTSSSRTRPTSPPATTWGSSPKCATSSRPPRSSRARMAWMRFAASCRLRRWRWPHGDCC